MPTQTASDLLAVTVPHDEGGRVAGFSQSEQRMCIGGFIWRRWDPHQASTLWAKDYESWEASGAESRWFADWAHGRTVRPSRVDVAFDFAVTDDVLSDHVVHAITDPQHPTHTREGLSLGINGQAGTNTHYIGSLKSDRRIRIYRRDLLHPYLLQQFGHPVLRVELVLKADHARAWWNVWTDDKTKAIEAAAAHVQSMCGFIVRDTVGTVPPLADPAPVAEPASEIFQFLIQHGPTITKLFDAGIDLVSLANEHTDTVSQRTSIRAANSLRRYRTVGADAIEEAVRMLIHARKRHASA
jgi:hypothetical protein